MKTAGDSGSDAASTEPARAQISHQLLRITSAIADAVSDDEVFHALVDRVAAVVGASSAGLWLVDDDTRTASFVRSVGYSAETRSALDRVPIDLEPQLPFLVAIRTGSAVWIPTQAALLERFPHLATMVTARRDYRISCLPISVDGRIAGALALTVEAEAPAAPDEQELLGLVARFASQAVTRLRLLERERRSLAQATAAAQRLALLGRVSRHFNESALDLPTRLQTITAEVGGAFDCCAGVFLIEDDGLLHASAVHHPIADARAALAQLAVARPVTIGDGVIGKVVASGASVLIEQIQPEDVIARAAGGYREFLERFPSYALMSAPMWSDGRVIGALSASRVRAGETFFPDDLRLLEELAERAATAIQNSRLYAAAERSRLRAESAATTAELFTGMLAHDLRTPLQAIMMAGELVGRRRSEASAASLAENILVSGRRMATMIGQLIDLTRARIGGGIVIERAPCDLGEICTESLAELALVHPDWIARQELAGDLCGRWDRVRLLQVVSNLVSNAGEHGEGGRITLHADGADEGAVILRIRNDGLIATARMPDLFDPFRSARDERASAAGLGLGLFIVRSLVEAHGGTVTAESTPSEGTTMTVRLPRDAAARRSNAPP